MESTDWNAKPWQHVLAFFELTKWTIDLVGDMGSMVIFADSHTTVGGMEVFDVLLAGRPPKLLVVAEVPLAIIAEMRSTAGLPEPQ